MGDRNDPIKFGPEWLRNLARENSTGGSSSNNQNVAGFSGSSGAGAAGPAGGAASTSGAAAGASNTPNTAPKVLLAKLRYGREEMLALYDRTSEAPPELRNIDVLYQSRGKPPVALNNAFEDDMRDTMRGPPGSMSQADRFGSGRGASRGLSTTESGREVRGRGTRLALLRQQYGARGVAWHAGLRMPGYGGGADDEPTPMRSWNNGSNGGNAAVRNSGDLTEWAPNKMYRNKRPGTNTNWRQPTRDDGEEWRSPESGSRPRTSQHDKWERDWGDRPAQDKPQWNNRRTWVGGDTQSNHDDNLPEWATDGSEACGGTFDSSGAFHGYSNDDTNLPKNQETPYALTRSNTHGSFARSKTVEEGSDEWWASEKAKKLSPKRFDASDFKFKTLSPKSPDGNAVASTSAMQISGKDENSHLKTAEKSEASSAAPETPDGNTNNSPDDGFAKKSVRFAESKTFDSLMRSGDVNVEEPNDRGNFQSVMITPNNSLRQKHQHIVQAVSNIPASIKQNRKPAGIEILKIMQNKQTAQNASELSKQQQTSEEKIVKDLIELTLEERKLNQALQAARGNPLMHPSTASMSSGMASVVNSTSKMSNPALQLNMSAPMQLAMNTIPNIPSPGLQTAGMQMPTPRIHMQQPGMHLQSTGMQMQTSGMELQSPGIQIQSPSIQMQTPGMQMQSGMQLQAPAMQMQSPGMQMQSPGIQMSNPGMQMQASGMQMQSPGIQMSNPGMQMQASRMQMQSPGIQMSSPGMQMQMQSSGMPGITNSALNASLGLPHGPLNNTMGQPMGLPLQGTAAPVLPNQGMSNSGMNVTGMHTAGGMPNFQSSSGMQGMSSSNVANNSLFLGQNTNSASIQSTGDIPMPNQHGNQSNMYPMHGMQHSNSGTFAASIYGNMMPQTPTSASSNSELADQWYYEDPKQIIQGPFSSKDMYTWFSAGFFSPSLMVRRACDTVMRPLASYGPVVPFAQMDMLSYPMSSGFDSRNQGPQQGLGLDVNMSNMNDTNSMDSLQFGTVGLISNQPYGQQQQMVDSLWSQPTNPSELMWMQQAMNSRNDNRVNNLPMFFWDQQPSAIGSNALLPEAIAKEMKTEDQILAQLRASHNPQNMPFHGDPPASASSANKPEESYQSKMNTTPNLEELQKLMQEDTLKEIASDTETKLESQDSQAKSDSTTVDEQSAVEISNAKQQAQNKAAADAKAAKQAKSEAEKTAKNNGNKDAKIKIKKIKDDKKEESTEIETKEEDISKPEKISDDQSPTKIKKEEKTNKKDQEKEKKDWIKEKDGFTVVKGADKSANKDNKKKAEEVKAVEDAERKRREDERIAAEEEKKRKQADALKRQQEIQQQQQQRQASESVNKKAPWSAVSSHASQSSSAEGPTLAEIQRLEREKKLEQMKEQQQMMQIIAQQQAAALAREQEMQAGLGWAKTMGVINAPGQSLSEIQAEARKQAAAAVAAAAAAHVLDETPPPAQSALPPWNSPQNGGGFWDTQPNQPIAKPQVSSPQKVEVIKKKKITLNIPVKKETSPAAEFEIWCTTALTSWSTKIDVPTFVGFLRDIESPYEVKDYVKCYLGESKDTSDFARQFLERRSKLLRVGMVTPSDDLCSPAMAINPRTISGSDYQEVKGKGKKTKKNKMLKIDARILGFSVTASEDRINVGDIDTA